MSLQATPKNIIVVGGSLGGLFTGLALKRLHKDFNIRILERNPKPLLHDQGAGIVTGPDVQSFFQKYDATHTALTVTSYERVYLDRRGEVMHREDTVQRMTSWDLVYHVLRANFDGVGSEYAEPPEQDDEDQEVGGTASYEYGCTVTNIKATHDEDASSPMELTIHRASDSSNSPVSAIATADLIVAADGPSSTLRSFYFPSIQRTYAGYVAWRGTVPETLLSRAAVDIFSEKFAFYHTNGIQILAYLIPGKAGSTKPGDRLMNWVWYVNYAENSPEHVELMTDKHGRRHHVTLPACGVREEVWSRQRKRAEDILPPQFAELVGKTEVPFIQVITDAIAPKAILEDGRVVLLGDALANFRPHTAASTSQAAMNAITLAEAVGKMGNGGGKKVLGDWEEHVLDYAREMQRHGVRLGNRSQFGDHPLNG